MNLSGLELWNDSKTQDIQKAMHFVSALPIPLQKVIPEV